MHPMILYVQTIQRDRERDYESERAAHARTGERAPGR